MFHTFKKNENNKGIFEKEYLEDMQRKLAAATDFSYSVIDYRGEEITDSYLKNRYCHGNHYSRDCQTCPMNCAFAAAKAAFNNKPQVFECPYGLVMSAIPIILDEQFVGSVIAGRVRCKDPENLPDRDKNILEGINEMEDQSEEYLEIPEFSYTKIAAISNLVNDYIRDKCEKEKYHALSEDYARKEIHLNDLRKKNASLTRHSRINDMRSLRATILPQFLMSMLVTVSNYAILEGASETEKMVESMAAILRYYVDSTKDFVNLSTEIRFVEQYLGIITARYGKSFLYKITCAEQMDHFQIPKLILLPLVEQLVYYGVLTKNDKASFFCNVDFVDNRCIITLQYEENTDIRQNIGYMNQSGSIIDENSLNEQVNNIRKRLEYEYKDDYLLTINRNLVIIELPYHPNSSEVQP